VSKAARKVTAYTAKTTVVVSAEKPHAAWYVAYSGVGAEDAARNETVTDARTISLSSGRPVSAATAPRRADLVPRR
jgi:hypothetical protein